MNNAGEVRVRRSIKNMQMGWSGGSGLSIRRLIAATVGRRGTLNISKEEEMDIMRKGGV